MTRFRCSAVVLSLAVLAAGCSRTKAGGIGHELVWAVSSGDVPVATEVAKMWMSGDERRARVRIESLPRSTDDQRHLLAIELNAHLPDFDVLSLDVIWTGEFAENGWLSSLEDLRTTLESVSLGGPLESATWKDRLWAAPYVTGAAILYYRKDLVPVAPTTWEGMDNAVQAAQQTQAGRNLVPFVGQTAPYEGLVVNYLEYMWGAGGELFDESGSVLFDRQVAGAQDGEPTPARKALEFMTNARATGFYGPDFSKMREDEALAAFKKGDAIFMRNWTDKYQALTTDQDSHVKGLFDIAPLPTFHGQGTVSALGGTNLGVSRFSDNAKAAKDFVTFASTSPDVQRFLAQKKYPPVLASLYKEMAGDKVIALLSPEPRPDSPGGVLRDARARPPVPAWSAISDEIQQQVFSAYTGQVSPEDAVERIRAFIEVAVG